MKRALSLWLSILIGASLSCFAQGEQPTAPADQGSFEELPELKASEILQPEFLKGPHFTVRESVPTSSGANQFVIDSDYGVFDAGGNAMLMQRIAEIGTIAQLKDVSRTDQFQQSLVTAAKGPYNAAKNVVQDPGEAVSSAGKGLMKFMKRTGQTIKNVSKGQAEKSDENSAEKALGYTRAKRQIAAKFGVDLYSTNAVLQKELDGIAWASWAGGFTFSAATFPIGGAVGLGLTATNLSKTVGQLINEKSPAQLKAINRSTLLAIGASAKDTERFLENTAFTPTQQTAFVLNLKALNGVADRGAFVHAAAEKSSNEADALFCVQTSGLMSKVHESEKPLARIVMLGDFPVSIASDGTVVVVLQWDYAAWTAAAARFCESVQQLDAESGKKGILIAISGEASPRLKQELQARRIAINDRVNPGPLK